MSDAMNVANAQKAIESLRMGIPPEGFVRYFTVGRSKEIQELQQHLTMIDGTALLLKANYGTGKSHLIRLIREEAIAQNFAVSVVTLDSNSAVRFNRMDQIFSAVCRNIETPYKCNAKGIRHFFDVIQNKIKKNNSEKFWKELSNDDKWDYSESLDSQALFVAIRAWMTEDQDTQLIIEDWLYNPWNYKAQRKRLYMSLVEQKRKYFRDLRREWQFYSNGVFIFDTDEYIQSWSALCDLDRLALASGLKGLIILFDEFEDIITNLRRVNHKEAAFWNLFTFYSGKKFLNKTFFAVTPDFSEKCKQMLLNKNRFDFDYAMFDKLPKFEMSPLEQCHLLELCSKIIDTYKIAYEDNSKFIISESDIAMTIQNATSMQVQDRTRQAIKSVVNYLDRNFGEDN